MSLNLYRFTKKFALPLWYWYLAGLLALALTNFITITIPSYVKTIVNQLAINNNFLGLKPIALTIIVLGLTLIIVRSLSRVLIFWPGRALEATSKTYFFQRAIRLPYSFFFKQGMGDLISRLSNDLGQVRVLYAFGVLQAFNLFFLLIFTVTKMFTIHITLTLVCLFPLLSIIIIARYITPKMQKYSRLNQEAIGALTNKVTEAFVNVHTIQANSKETAFIHQAQAANREVFSTNMKLIAIRTFFFPLLATLTHLSQIVTLFYGGYEVTTGRITIGDILAFNIYLATLAFPLTFLGIIIAIYQRSKTAMVRLKVFENTPLEKALLPKEAPRVEEKPSPLLEIRNLNFSFSPTNSSKREAILEGINLKIEKGERVGIYGPIGCGKTTLLNLITRIYEPPENSIFFEGKDILTFEPQMLREQIAYALQSAHLFSDTILNNLSLGINPAPDFEEILLATQRAQIKNEIERFANGWQTQIGERGIRLSGGQKQRLSLARLLLRHPSLMLLDDVLSAVDQETGCKILKHITDFNQATIIISHRFEILKDCQKILLLDEGRVKDLGTYHDLIERHDKLK